MTVIFNDAMGRYDGGIPILFNSFQRNYKTAVNGHKKYKL